MLLILPDAIFFFSPETKFSMTHKNSHSLSLSQLCEYVKPCTWPPKCSTRDSLDGKQSVWEGWLEGAEPVSRRTGGVRVEGGGALEMARV